MKPTEPLSSRRNGGIFLRSERVKAFLFLKMLTHFLNAYDNRMCLNLEADNVRSIFSSLRAQRRAMKIDICSGRSDHFW